MELHLQSSHVSDLSLVAESLLKEFSIHRIFLFSGEMGAGKTTLIRELCKKLGSIDFASSPSYALVNEYLTIDGKHIFHFDFFRIKNTSEALDMGFDDYLHSGDHCLIEWPEKVAELLPENVVRIDISVNNGLRIIHATAPDN